MAQSNVPKAFALYQRMTSDEREILRDLINIAGRTGRKKPKRKMSAATKRKISKAQKARRAREKKEAS